MGVSTPKAAAVAAATVGLAILLHIANGRIFTIGLLSVIVAAGILEHMTFLSGNTIKGVGAAPNGHCSIAPHTTPIPIYCTAFSAKNQI